MTKETAIGMLRVAQNGNQMLEVLDTLAADSVGFTYVESPAIEQACLATCFTEYNLLFSLDIATGLNWVRSLIK